MFFFPTLHIKLRLMKKIVKILARKSSKGFEYVKAKFPKITEAKLKEGVFIGPQIKKKTLEGQPLPHSTG